MTTIALTGQTFNPASLLALVRGWRYVAGKRDLRLDLLRGFACFAMVVDHVGGRDSFLYPLTGGNRFFVSAAEAFVFIAGLTMGCVYTGLIARDGLRAAVVKALRRSGSLYWTTLKLTFGFAAVSYALGLPWAPQLTAAELPGWALGVVTFHQTYFLTDIPLLYALLIFAAAPLLVALAMGQTRWVVLGSWAVWAAWQVMPEQAHVPWEIRGNTVFNVAAWQVLFVNGLAIGFHRRALERRLAGLSPWAVLATTGALAAGAALLWWTQERPGGLLADGSLLARQLHGKADVPLGRIAVFAVFFAFLYAAVSVAWAPLERALGWLLLPLGQNALTAYALHLFVTAVLAGFLPTWSAVRTPAENTAIQMVGVLVVWSIITLRPAVTAHITALLTRRPLAAPVASPAAA